MTFLDMIELYNIAEGNELNDIEAIFSDVVLDQRLDKSILAGVLLDYCGAMDCIYTTSPTFKYFSDSFFKKWAWNISKLCDTLTFQYDPLKNKNLEWTETTQIEQNLDTEEDRTRANTGTQGNSYSDTKSNTHSDSDTYDETDTNTISAMNSSSYEPDNKKVIDGSKSNSGNFTETDSGSNTRTDNLNERINATKGEDLNWDETDRHVESGTDGVAYQDLIQKERKLAEFNIYNWIANKYAHELFLLVY